MDVGKQYVNKVTKVIFRVLLKAQLQHLPGRTEEIDENFMIISCPKFKPDSLRLSVSVIIVWAIWLEQIC